LIFTHLLNAFLFLAPAPYFSRKRWCLERVRPRSSAQAPRAFSLSRPFGAEAAAFLGDPS
jgi:hypothetical protein